MPIIAVLAARVGARGRSVTAPKVALLTSREYFAKAPRRAYGFGAPPGCAAALQFRGGDVQGNFAAHAHRS